MYEDFYRLRAKPFQLNPDPSFFFGSKGHKRAMAYLEYGLHQGEGFIVITGEIGAGKTTLMRNLLRNTAQHGVMAGQLVSTQLDAEDILRSAAAAFGLPHENAGKAVLLGRLEEFFRACHEQGKRALLVVDEAQNLTARAVEELRMLSNFQTAEKSLLQSFLLGQPEFRRTLQSSGMQQLRQRVIASYHLGPLDEQETRAYIEHRLRMAGWEGDPSLSPDAHGAIYAHSGGIPRRINMLCDRLLLMGYLEGKHAFDTPEVAEVVADFRQETALPEAASPADAAVEAPGALERLDERLGQIEKTMAGMLKVLHEMRAAAGRAGNGQ